MICAVALALDESPAVFVVIVLSTRTSTTFHFNLLNKIVYKNFQFWASSPKPQKFEMLENVESPKVFSLPQTGAPLVEMNSLDFRGRRAIIRLLYLKDREVPPKFRALKERRRRK